MTDFMMGCYPGGVPEDFPVDLFAPIPDMDNAGVMVMRDLVLQRKIDQFTEYLLQLPQIDLDLVNTFAGGVYSRQITIPKGTVIVGALHLTDHFNVCLRGDLTFVTVDGPQRITGPCMFVAPGGTKKVAYANEETVWVNFHRATHDNPQDIVDSITVKTYAEFDRLMNKANFLNAVGEFGFDEDSVQRLSEDPDTFDASPMEGLEVRDSGIAGKGLFVTRDYAMGEVIGPVQSGDKRTLAGRYVNHSIRPNIKVMAIDGVFNAVATRFIQAREELTSDYADTLRQFIQGEV